ncbi:MAG: biopolymer transporter ExbD [Bdellovibrio sp. CG10_big_fil_rev_8_21_14_0_10_47_8]|nr:MAG: biopolymer transporter ExbD [Bdellovibrio sp. CG10_big_fil_rev_8_21_14_0_10_47_8]
MKSSHGDNDEAISDINVVPLVDIILVVLIIFMVTAPMIMKPSINVNLPKAASGDQTTPSLLNISISVGGKLNLNGSASDEQSIQTKAQQEVGKNPDIQAVIAADKDVPHGTVVHMIDLVKSVGVKKFAISIEKSK